MRRPRGRPLRPFLCLALGFAARDGCAWLIGLRRAFLVTQQRLLMAGGYLEVPLPFSNTTALVRKVAGQSHRRRSYDECYADELEPQRELARFDER